MRSRLWPLVGVVALLLAFLVPQAGFAADVDPENSAITVTSGHQATVDGAVNISLSLKDDAGNAVSPNAGKIYIWANTADGVYTENLGLNRESVPEGTYMHGNYAKGVILVDAKSMGSDVKFSVNFSKPGDYILNAVYFSADTAFDINYANYYWPYMLQKATEGERSVSVTAKATEPEQPAPNPGEPEQPGEPQRPPTGGDSVPSSDKVGYAFFNGFVNDHAVVTMPIFAGGRTPTDKGLPLPDDGETIAKVEVLLYQPNGYPVANGTPVSIKGAPGITVVEQDKSANGLGRFNFRIKGEGAEATYVTMVVDNSWRVKVPVTPYGMGPKRVMLVVGSAQMEVDGAQVDMDVAPFIKDKRTFVPFRALGEVIGDSVVYNKRQQSVTFTNGGDVLVMTLGSTKYTMNGKLYEMDVAPFVESNRTFVPLRFVSEAFGYDVEALRGQSGTAAIVLTR